MLVTPALQHWLDDGLRDPEGFWARGGRGCRGSGSGTASSSGPSPRSAGSSARETNLAYNALDHHVAHGRGDHTALIYFNERGEQRSFTYAELLDEVERVAAALRALGIAQGRPAHDLHADVPGGDRADARDGPHRRDPLRGVRRLRRARARRSHQRQRIAAGVHRRRHLSQGQGGRAQVDRRRGARARAACRRACRRAAARQHAGAAEGRSRDRRGTTSSTRGAGHSGAHEAMEANEPAYILATSGTTARPKLADSHPRRLPGPHRQHGTLVLRAEAGRRVVGDVGHRLDRRPQLHGLRAAHRRLHDRRVRRRARPSAAPTRTGAPASRSSASPASSRRPPRCAC